jgi:Protein of unknown function (DUF4089)
MAAQPFDAGAYLDAAAAAIDLSIAPEHRPGVILNLERLASMADLVMAFPLAEEIAPAPVFRP